jgi:hypothetical protein
VGHSQTVSLKGFTPKYWAPHPFRFFLRKGRDADKIRVYIISETALKGPDQYVLKAHDFSRNKPIDDLAL